MWGFGPVMINEPTVRKAEGCLSHWTYEKTEKIVTDE